MTGLEQNSIPTGTKAWDGAQRPLSHVAELDGLRGVAIALVLVLHLIASALGPLRRVVGAGWVGVDLFFVLSGFLITRILLSSLGSPHLFRNFYARRVLRIWPLYYFMVCFAFYGARLLPAQWHTPGSLLPFYATFTQNWLKGIGFGPWALAVTWSLAIEEQFYLLWPLCARFFGPRGLLWLSTMLLVIAPVLRFIALSRGLPAHIVYISTWCRFDTLGAGAIAAVLLRAPLRPSVERLSRLIMTVALGLAGICCVVLFKGDELILEKSAIGGVRALGFSVTFSLLAVGFGALVMLAASARLPQLAAFLRNRSLRYLGKISFGVYLIHGALVPFSQTAVRSWVSRNFDVSRNALNVLVLVVTVLGTFILAELSWRFLETPMLRLRRFFPAREP